MTETYTRACLLADWASINSSQPLSQELQDLFLTYFNDPLYFELSGTEQSAPQKFASPPKRFRRKQWLVRSKQDLAPNGPSPAAFDNENMQ